MFDEATTTRIHLLRAVEQMVDLNNYGVYLLGDGRLECARVALCKASKHIKYIKDMQERLAATSETIDSLEIEDMSCGEAGICFVTPLESIAFPPPPAYSTDDISHSEREHFTPPPPTTTASSSSSPVTSFSTPSNNQRDVHSFSSDQDDASSYMAQTKNEGPPRQQSPPQQEQESKSALSYSFLRPILINSEDFIYVPNPPMTKLSISLFFNLAVINHKLALLAPSPMEMWPPLEEAIYSYRLAYSLQLEEMEEVSRLHTLGMVNNLGLLYHHAEMYTFSKGCFQTLLEMITMDRVQEIANMESYGIPVAMESLYARYTEIFLDNIFDFLTTHTNAPAA